MEVQSFGIVIDFKSKHNNAVWTLVSVYGPCMGQLRDQFVSWCQFMVLVWVNSEIILFHGYTTYKFHMMLTGCF